MNSKVSIGIIVVAVVGLLSFMVSVIQDFNEASFVRSSGMVTAKDSLLSARLDSLYAKDSILTAMVLEQNKKIESMGNSIVNIKSNITTISKIITENK